MRILLITTSNVDGSFLYALNEDSEAAKIVEAIGPNTVFEVPEDAGEAGIEVNEERTGNYDKLGKLLEDNGEGIEMLTQFEDVEETLDLTSFSKVRHIHFVAN